MDELRRNLSASDLESFRELVERLAGIAQDAYRVYADEHPGMAFERKADGTRVTDLDRDIEQRWRDCIETRFPAHAIVGEEYGGSDPGGDFCWYLDPVDGTDDISRGIPLSGFIATLTLDRLPIAAAVGHPALDIQTIALYGYGCHVNRRLISDMDARGVSDPAIALPALDDFSSDPEGIALFSRLGTAFPNHRIYRNVFAHTAVLSGALEAAMEFDVAEWDVLATRLLVEEAGGHYAEFRLRKDDSGLRKVGAVFGVSNVVERLLDIISSIN